ncbi:MAG: hypothetical protein M1296_03770 [Chloroflexi bacterium]|nr:hypothetical protein [Chloroflexota bacterium]
MVGTPEPYSGDTTRSPIVACTIGSIVCSFLAIGIIAAYLPQAVPLVWPLAFLAASGVLLATAIVCLLRLRQFAWPLFFAVARWILVLTAVFVVLSVYVFTVDGTNGVTLTVLAIVLVLTALNVPILVGFSVARHERGTTPSDYGVPTGV